MTPYTYERQRLGYSYPVGWRFVLMLLTRIVKHVKLMYGCRRWANWSRPHKSTTLHFWRAFPKMSPRTGTSGRQDQNKKPVSSLKVESAGSSLIYPVCKHLVYTSVETPRTNPWRSSAKTLCDMSTISAG